MEIGSNDGIEDGLFHFAKKPGIVWIHHHVRTESITTEQILDIVEYRCVNLLWASGHDKSWKLEAGALTVY
jgi:hypothetical protein